MDVVDTRANVTGVLLVLEDLQELGVALGVLNRQNVSIERSDGVEEVLELRVAEVRVGLQGVGDTGSSELEGFDSPLEIGIPVRPSEGKL